MNNIFVFTATGPKPKAHLDVSINSPFTKESYKKYLKNNIDFENLTKLSSSYPSKYKNLIRLKLDEKKIIKKNKKIIFTGKSNLVIKIFDLK